MRHWRRPEIPGTSRQGKVASIARIAYPAAPAGAGGPAVPQRRARPEAIVSVLVAALLAALPSGATVAASSREGARAGSADRTYEARASSPAAGAERWIVVLRAKDRAADPGVARTVAGLAAELRFRPSHVYERAVPGFAATLDAAQRAALRADPRVRYLHRDRPLELTGQLDSPAVRRVNAHLAPATSIDEVDVVGDRIDADIAILDTGVDASHPDLNVAGGVDCTDHPGANGSPVGHPVYGDINGHGTHVAGIAAAIDNGFGVVGVAPGARIWSVRIFAADINGWESNLICGIEWVTAQRDGDRPRMEVANMSMRIREDDDGDPVGDDGQCGQSVDRPDPVHAAMCASVAAGNVYAVAAGNERNDAKVYIPASYDEVITVSALADFDGLPGGLAPTPTSCRSNSNGVPDVDDTFADFSTRGADVDIIAPGVCVSSTYRGGGYRSMSGTSMATPAVAGGVALYRLAEPDTDPAQVRAALIAAGNHDWATETDPDGVPERLLDVRSAGAPADFRLAIRPSVRGAPAGGSRSYDIGASRGFAFPDAIALSLDTSGLPAGVTAELSAADLSRIEDVA
ncbi:MAG: S8 family serine peptidase, partial [Chloroflexi bacterium]|nr:S8 family serine peptidase [Chloroflexota bacterium]